MEVAQENQSHDRLMEEGKIDSVANRRQAILAGLSSITPIADVADFNSVISEVNSIAKFYNGMHLYAWMTSWLVL